MDRAQKFDIFISYSQKDRKIVDEITRQINDWGYTFYIDRDGLTAGSDFANVIIDAINASDLFLVVVSKASMESRWVLNEISYAQKQDKKIVPLLIDSDEKISPELNLMFAQMNMVGYTNENLRKTLEALLGKRERRETNDSRQKDDRTAIAGDQAFNIDDYVPRPIDCDVFISYRRVDGRDYARNILQSLKLLGYPKVFFDYNSLRDGVFNTQIIDAIYSCKDFILVISPLALKNCSRKSDWVALEIRKAIKYHKKIIPVVIEDTFMGWPEDFPSDLAQIKQLQFHKLMTDEYFEDSMERLSQRLETVATEAVSLDELKDVNPVRSTSESFTYKLKVNVDSSLFIDDEEVQQLTASRLHKLTLPRGEYVRKVVAKNNDKLFDESILNMECDKAEVISLRKSFWRRLLNL